MENVASPPRKRARERGAREDEVETVIDQRFTTFEKRPTTIGAICWSVLRAWLRSIGDGDRFRPLDVDDVVRLDII